MDEPVFGPGGPDPFAAKAAAPDPRMESGKNVAAVVYGLYAASFLLGITIVVGIVMCYLKKDEYRGTWLESHFTWQARTFWWSVAWAVVGGLTAVLLIGFLILAVDAVWLIYRIAKGWMNLNDNKPMYL